MKLYKLTDESRQTHNNTQWGAGVTHSGTGEGELCGPGWIHAYTHPLLAVLLNPVHVGFKKPRLWEAEGEVARTDHGLKVGCLSLTTLCELPLPVITTTQRVRFAILCAKEVCKNKQWNAWADAWLSGKDRTKESARARAAEAARAWAAAEAAEAAWAAAEAAEAAWAARAWAAAEAARAWAAAEAAATEAAAAWAAEAAAAAAEAAEAAEAAAEAAAAAAAA